MAGVSAVLAILDIATKFFPVILQTGENLKPFAESIFKQLKGDELTMSERIELHEAVERQYAKAMEPLPPAQPGDPDYKD